MGSVKIAKIKLPVEIPVILNTVYRWALVDTKMI